MTNSTSKRIAFVTLLALLAPIAATAQQQPPRPDMGAMAADMGVTEAALKTCMPAPAKGERPERPDAAKITKCLNGEDQHVAQSDVDAVLKANAPKGKG